MKNNSNQRNRKLGRQNLLRAIVLSMSLSCQIGDVFGQEKKDIREQLIQSEDIGPIVDEGPHGIWGEKGIIVIENNKKSFFYKIKENEKVIDVKRNGIIALEHGIKKIDREGKVIYTKKIFWLKSIDEEGRYISRNTIGQIDPNTGKDIFKNNVANIKKRYKSFLPNNIVFYQYRLNPQREKYCNIIKLNPEGKLPIYEQSVKDFLDFDRETGMIYTEKGRTRINLKSGRVKEKIHYNSEGYTQEMKDELKKRGIENTSRFHIESKRNGKIKEDNIVSHILTNRKALKEGNIDTLESKPVVLVLAARDDKDYIEGKKNAPGEDYARKVNNLEEVSKSFNVLYFEIDKDQDLISALSEIEKHNVDPSYVIFHGHGGNTGIARSYGNRAENSMNMNFDTHKFKNFGQTLKNSKIFLQSCHTGNKGFLERMMKIFNPQSVEGFTTSSDCMFRIKENEETGEKSLEMKIQIQDWIDGDRTMKLERKD